MKRFRPKALAISWPAAAILVLAYAIYVAKMVCALLTLLAAEWSSYGAAVTVCTVVLVVAGLVALVWSVNRSDQPRTMADHLRQQDEEGTTTRL
ncbi:MAG: hypothetical protein ACRDQE_02670 [Gaiellales bacterium]